MNKSLFSRMRNHLHSLGCVLGEMESETLGQSLPLFVTGSFEFAKVALWGRDTFVALARGHVQFSPEQIIAQKKILEKHAFGNFVFVFPRGSKEFCRSLIAGNVPFIIPGRQVFFPEVMVSLREDKFNRSDIVQRDHLSPWAQVILLYHLLNRSHGNILPFLEIQDKLHANKVYVSRAAQELERLEIAEIATNGRLKSLVFPRERQKIWLEHQDKMSSPVMKRIRLQALPVGSIAAGISALSKYSLLEDNPNQTRAICSKGMRFNKEEVLKYSGSYLELWKYDPVLLADEGDTVDKLSLYLSLRDDTDPRVVGELQKMMEDFQWEGV